MAEGKKKFPSTRPVSNLGNAYVNKSNALIRASYKLSLNEQRVVLASVAKLDSRRMAQSGTRDQISRIRIYASEYSETFKVSPKDAYAALREGSARLYDRSIQTFDGRVKERFRWILKESYAEGEGYVELSFTPDAAIYLTALRNRFTSYQLKRVAHLRSIYSIRLFEYLAAYRDTGLFRISLEDLILELALPYTRWVHVKQRVIDPAIEELQAKSNIDISYEAEKTGRRISMIVFRFTLAAQGKLDFLGDDEETQKPGDFPQLTDSHIEETQNSG